MRHHRPYASVVGGFRLAAQAQHARLAGAIDIGHRAHRRAHLLPAIARARLAATVDLPTPPLPDATAITLAHSFQRTEPALNGVLGQFGIDFDGDRADCLVVSQGLPDQITQRRRASRLPDSPAPAEPPPCRHGPPGHVPKRTNSVRCADRSQPQDDRAVRDSRAAVIGCSPRFEAGHSL